LPFLEREGPARFLSVTLKEIKMKTMNKLAASAVALLGLCVAPTTVRAEDDYSNDAKIYAGAACDSQVSSTPSTRVGAFYVNLSGGVAPVVCPVIQDSWTNTAGLAYSYITISNAGGTFSCTESAYDTNGTLQSSRAFSVTTTGLQRQYFYTTSYLPTTANEGYMTITCNVPNNSQIKNYLVQEKV
jgi:hypothetical protein